MIPQHILVPIDFSLYANQALDYTLRFVEVLQTVDDAYRPRLTLLHVLEVPMLPVGAERTLGAYLQQAERQQRQQLEADYTSRVREAGLECTTAVVSGVPFQAIVDLARARQVDLISMATHGRTGLSHILLGSVADKVVRLAPCPVLVVRARPTP
jgi:universal stress protein A